LNPAPDGDAIDGRVPLSHHLFQLPEVQRITQVATNAQDDDLTLEVSPFEQHWIIPVHAGRSLKMGTQFATLFHACQCTQSDYIAHPERSDRTVDGRGTDSLAQIPDNSWSQSCSGQLTHQRRAPTIGVATARGGALGGSHSAGTNPRSSGSYAKKSNIPRRTRVRLNPNAYARKYRRQCIVDINRIAAD
jgi:hypothetical protein